MVEAGRLLVLEIEKPAAGGRMLARHQGQIVFVSGAIPGERVLARVERIAKGLAFAETIDVRFSSPDRRLVEGDWRCGGNVLAHVAYPRQLQLKGDILKDAFGRIARVPLPAVPTVIGSPEQGYRMRARLHAHDGRLGFYREGTHHLCDAAQTAQLLPATNAWVAHAQSLLLAAPASVYGGLAGIEIAENIAGDVRACHLELHPGVEASPFRALADGLVGLSAQRADGARSETLAGTPVVTDAIRFRADAPEPVLNLQRDVRAFFQSNRFLLERLVRHVIALVPPGPVVDLYAGVGLFGLSLAAAGAEGVTAVEGDPISGADLRRNAQPFGDRVRVERRSVEEYLAGPGRQAPGAYVVDPPRTGMSKEALAAIVAAQPSTIVYVSCDVATLARDTRLLLDGGYELGQLTGVDLFPNTAHVETVALFARAR